MAGQQDAYELPPPPSIYELWPGLARTATSDEPAAAIPPAMAPASQQPPLPSRVPRATAPPSPWDGFAKAWETSSETAAPTSVAASHGGPVPGGDGQPVRANAAVMGVPRVSAEEAAAAGVPIGPTVYHAGSATPAHSSAHSPADDEPPRPPGDPDPDPVPSPGPIPRPEPHAPPDPPTPPDPPEPFYPGPDPLPGPQPFPAPPPIPTPPIPTPPVPTPPVPAPPAWGAPVSGPPGFTVPPPAPRPLAPGTIYPSTGGRPRTTIPPVADARSERPAWRPGLGDRLPGARPPGTVYGGTIPRQYSPMENSGSLTGHILDQASSDIPPPKSGTSKIIILVFVLVLLVAAGLAVAAFADAGMAGLLKRALNG